MALERGQRGLLQVTNSELDDWKVQSYIRGNIEILQSEKMCVGKSRAIYFINILFI